MIEASPGGEVRACVTPTLFNMLGVKTNFISTKGLQNVAKPMKGKTVLTEQALEDIIIYLLKTP